MIIQLSDYSSHPLGLNTQEPKQNQRQQRETDDDQGSTQNAGSPRQWFGWCIYQVFFKLTACHQAVIFAPVFMPVVFQRYPAGEHGGIQRKFVRPCTMAATLNTQPGRYVAVTSGYHIIMPLTPMMVIPQNGAQ